MHTHTHCIHEGLVGQHLSLCIAALSQGAEDGHVKIASRPARWTFRSNSQAPRSIINLGPQSCQWERTGMAEYQPVIKKVRPSTYPRNVPFFMVQAEIIRKR